MNSKSNEALINIKDNLVIVKMNNATDDILKDIVQFIYWNLKSKNQNNLEVNIIFDNNVKNISKSFYLGLISSVGNYTINNVFLKVVFFFNEKEVECLNYFKEKTQNSLKNIINSSKIEFRTKNN